MIPSTKEDTFIINPASSKLGQPISSEEAVKLFEQSLKKQSNNLSKLHGNKDSIVACTDVNFYKPRFQYLRVTGSYLDM